MARSTYIYTLFYDGLLCGAFSVKYELIDCLPESFENYNDLYKVYRVRDGVKGCAKVENITAQIGGEAYEV